MNDFLLNIIASLNRQVSKRQLKADVKTMDNSMYVKVIAKLSTALSKRQLKKDIKELNDLYIKIGADLKIDKSTKSQLQKRIKELQNSIEAIEIKTKVAKKSLVYEVDSARRVGQTRANKAPISFDFEVKKNKAISDIEYLGKRFSKLFSNTSAKQKYNNLLNSAFSISDDSQLRSVRTQISAFTSELKSNGLASKSLGDKWKALVERSKDLFSAASIVTTIFTQVRQAVSTFVDLDTAMTGVYKVTDDITSRDQFSGLLTKWNKLAQNLSITTMSLINSAEEWSKIGFDLDMSEQLAQVTAIFEKTAEISSEKANSTLISVAQAFPEIDNYGEEDYVERITAIGNKINKVGNEFAISSEGISDALQNSSAALRMANNDLDESIAISTTANKIFQDPDEVGNMAKILSARLRGQKGELEKLGEDTDGMIESVSKIQTQILNLTHNKVNIFEDDNETLKSTYQMVLEIGKVFDTLSDKDQASLLEIMGGKQRMSAVASLLLNYKELEKVKEASMNADKSMEEEYNKYLGSAEAHIISFKEKLTEAYSGFMSGDMIKYTADVGSGLLDLVTSTDLLRHSLLAVVALKVGKGISSIGAAVASTTKQMNTLGSAIQQVKNLPLDDSSRTNALYKLGESTKNLTEKNLELLLSQKNLTQQDRLAILSKHSLTEEESLAKLEKLGLTTATNAQTAANAAETASTFTLSGALTSLKASAVGMWTSIKTAIAANPIGFALTVLTTTVSIATSVISDHNQELEEAKEKTKQLADEVADEEKNLVSLIAQYNKLDKTDRSTENTEQIKRLNEQINEALGDQADNIDLVNGKLDEQSDKLKRNLLQKLQDDKTKIDASVSVAKGSYDEGADIGSFFDAWGDIGSVLNDYGATSVVDRKIAVDKGNVGAILKNQNTEQQIKQLKEWIELLNEADKKAGVGTYADEISTLQNKLAEAEKIKTTYDEALANQRKNSEQQKILNDSLNGKVADSKAFEEYRNNIKETYKENGDLQNQMLDFVDTIFPDFAKKVESTSNELAKAKNEIKKSTSFDEAWGSLDNITDDKSSLKDTKKDLLELAKAGKLTVKAFNGTKGSNDFLAQLGITEKDADKIEKIISKINDMVSSADQLASMKSGISSISSILGEKKENLSNKKTKNEGIGADTLSGMPDDVKSQTKEYENFVKVLGNGASTMQQCREAANNLATAYVNSYNFLSKLTPETVGYYTSVLKQMGVENASEVVTNALAKQTYALRLEKLANSNATKEEITALQEEASQYGITSTALANYVIQKRIANNNALDTSKSINNLIKLAKQCGATSNVVIALQNLLKSTSELESLYQKDLTDFSSNSATDLQHAPDAAANEKSEALGKASAKISANRKRLLKLIKDSTKIGSSVKIKPTTSSGSGSKKSKDSSKNTKTEINWLERRLTRMQSIIDLTASKLQNLFSVKAKNNNLDKQIKQTTKLMNQYKIAADTYMKKANSVSKSGGLSKDIIKKVQSGEITKASYSKLIKKYDQKKADKINSYIDYYDKAQDAKRNAEDQKAKKRELQIQKNQNYVDLYNSRTSRAEAKEAISIGSTAKNKAVDTQIKNTKLSYDYQIKIAKLNKDKAEYEKLQYELEKKITELKLKQIQNIQDEYEKRIGLVDNDAQDINNRISLAQARGKIVSFSYYQDLNRQQINKRELAVQERKKVQDELNNAIKEATIKVGSDEWYEIQSTLQDLDNTISECDIMIAENTNSIRQLHTDLLDAMASNANRMNSEADFLAKILSRNQLTNSKTGEFTREGIGTLGTYGINLEVSQYQMRELNKERAILEQMKKEGILDYGDNGKHTYNSLEQLEEAYDNIITKQQEWTQNEFEAEQKIIDLMKEYYQTQIDYMKEIIDAKKKVIDLQADLYNYEKNIVEKTRNIAILEKQVAGLQGDDSEEGRARLAKLQVSLDEANRDLANEEYDRYISDQQNMLDNMMSQYEDLMQNLFNDTDKLLQDGINAINKSSVLIKSILDKTASDYNYNYSDNFKDIIAAFGENKIVVTGVKQSLNGDNSSISSKLDYQNNYLKEKYSEDSKSGNGGVQTTPTVNSPAVNSTPSKVNTTEDKDKKSGELYNSNFQSVMHKIAPYLNSNIKNPKSDLNKLIKKKSDFVISSKNNDADFKKIAKALGVSTKVDYTKNGAVYKYLKSNGFQTGGIVRANAPKTGDNVWVRVNPDETILTKKFTDILPRSVDIMENLTKQINLPDYSNNVPKKNIESNQTFGDINVTLELPNVKDYKSFREEMKSDPKSRQMFTELYNDCSRYGRIGNRINLN